MRPESNLSNLHVAETGVIGRGRDGLGPLSEAGSRELMADVWRRVRIIASLATCPVAPDATSPGPGRLATGFHQSLHAWC